MAQRVLLKRFNNLILIVLLGISFAALNGCAPRYLEKTPLAVLRYPYIPVDPEELTAFQAQIDNDPYHPETAKARFWIAQNDFNSEQWAKAEKQFRQIAQKHPNSEWATSAGLMAARCQVKLKERLAALAGLGRLRLASQEQLQWLEAIESLARKIINDELNLTELAQVRATYPETEWAQQALFVIGKRNLDEGNPELAVKSFEQFLALYPSHALVALVRDLMDKAMRIVPVNRRRIGCLLPLSGLYEPYGTTIRQGLELALMHINQSREEDDRLGLAFIDTSATTMGAVAAFKLAVEKEKVITIIGPTLSNSVKALVPELEKSKIALITTSAADPTLAGISPYVFRYLLTNQEQGEAMAEYVVLRRNLQRIGVLHGEAAYDRSLGDAFVERVKKLGGEVVAHLEYPQGATDFKTQLLALGGVDPGYLKDLESRQRRAMESMMEKIAHGAHVAVVPESVIAAAQANPDNKAAGRRLAIIRLAEKGNQTQKETLGKVLTEKLSYALASKPGLEVLSQAKTFKALRSLGLSTLELTKDDLRKLADTLDVEYIVTGEITQGKEEPVHYAGEALPILYEVRVELIQARTAKEMKTFVDHWTKSIPPEENTKDLEAIYLPVPAHDAILIASQLAFYDLKAEIFGCDAWMTPKLFREAGPELNGATIASGFWPEDLSPRNQEFIQQFQAQNKNQPSLLAVQAYDALQLVASVLKTLEKNSARREDFHKALLKVRDFQGVTGRASVDRDGEIKREAVFLKMKDKQFEKVR